MEKYRFALRPKWIFGHVLVLVLAVTFINLGFWQLRRLHQRKAFNHLVEVNQSRPRVPVGRALPRGSDHSQAKRDQGRPVRARGRYENDRTLVIRGQSVNDVPGVWVVTPLVLDDGRAVLVNRGFYANNGAVTAPPSRTAGPAGTVTVDGTIQPTETPGAFEHRDPTGRHDDYARMDLDRIADSVPQPLLPGWVLLTHQRPGDPGRHLTRVPAPTLTEGPHLSYAIQWFSFTAIGLIGYPLLLARKARETQPDDEDGTSSEDLSTGGAAGGLGAEPLRST